MTRHLRVIPEEGSLTEVTRRTNNPHPRPGALSLGAPASPPACPDESAERRPFQVKLPPGWRSRGYVPHFEDSLLVQSLGFRLHDAIPASVLQGWRDDLAWTEGLPASDPREILLRKLIAKHEDAGHGAAGCGTRESRTSWRKRCFTSTANDTG